MSNIQKYNYDIVVVTDREISQYGEFLKANDSIIFSFSDDMKRDMESSPNRDQLIRSLVVNPDMGVCLGFNFIGTEERRGQKFWTTAVYYYNPNKDILKHLGVKLRK